MSALKTSIRLLALEAQAQQLVSALHLRYAREKGFEDIGAYEEILELSMVKAGVVVSLAREKGLIVPSLSDLRSLLLWGIDSRPPTGQTQTKPPQNTNPDPEPFLNDSPSLGLSLSRCFYDDEEDEDKPKMVSLGNTFASTGPLKECNTLDSLPPLECDTPDCLPPLERECLDEKTLYCKTIECKTECKAIKGGTTHPSSSIPLPVISPDAIRPDPYPYPFVHPEPPPSMSQTEGEFIKVSFKTKPPNTGEKSEYDSTYAFPDQSVYFGRKKSLKPLSNKIKNGEEQAKLYAPRDPSLSGLLSSRGAHGKIFFVRAGEAPFARKDCDGYYLKVFSKKNGVPPTNSLYKLKENGQDWEKLEFSEDPIYLYNNDRYCIGGQFHFKIGKVDNTRRQKNRRRELIPPKPFDMAPMSVVGDAPSDDES